MPIIKSFKTDKIKNNLKEGKNLKYKNEKETKEKKIALEENITNSIKKEKKENNWQSSITSSRTNFNYKTTINKRSKTGLKEYMEKKRKKEKLKEQAEEMEKVSKKINRFRNLFNLNQNIMINLFKNENIPQTKKEEKINNKTITLGKKDKSSDISLKRKNSNQISKSKELEQNNYYHDLIMIRNILENNEPNNNIK